ncbi:MAG: hypothetical protein ACR2IL_01410 [Chitinophagaceae bacterium]
MKKLFFLFVAMLGLFTDYAAYAGPVFGLEVRIVRGRKEWNADKTSLECVGRGICEIIIKGTIGSSAPQSLGTLGRTDDGRLALSLPASILSDRTWSDTFVRGYVDLEQELLITPDIASKIKNCPSKIKVGRYAYKQVGDYVVLYFE